MKNEMTKQLLSLFIVVLLGIFAVGSADTEELAAEFNETVQELAEEAEKAEAASGETTSTVSGDNLLITNKTGYEIYYIYVGPTTDTLWGDDHLDSDQTLSDNESFTVSLDGFESKIIDIMLEDEDEDTYTFFSYDAGANNHLTVTLDHLDND